MKRNFFTTRSIATLAVLTAIGYALSWLEFPLFPAASFLKLDFSTFVTLFGGYMFGLPGAIVIEGIKQLLIWGTKSSTGGIGEIANFITAIAFVAVPSILYRFKKSRGWAAFGLCIGCVCQMGASMLCNRYITFPLFAEYLGMTAGEAFASLWQYVLGFNAIKSVAMSVLVFFLYKRLSFLLKKYVLERPRKKSKAVAAESAAVEAEVAAAQTETVSASSDFAPVQTENTTASEPSSAATADISHER